MVDLPTRSSSDIREEQLKDADLKKIIETFEQSSKDENFLDWTSRGYLMPQGVLHRNAPETDSEEAQLVVPKQEWDDILKAHHGALTAGHYDEEGTYQRISKRYYWSGMRSFISDYVKKCPKCSRYKAENQKPAGLLRIPAYSQRFETLTIDLLGPLPETSDWKKWIFIIEDTATKGIELFALKDATAQECAITWLEEVILRYGLPRRLISDN
ncbi:Transposon Tf2-11 polyprotein like [Argiope bruennichi]|uniref:RNA-directed DNA polymerase n=1 Tax=Argiope bruennichi TaxID=94029 RepID=A0A8T0EH91_ARGBR|nr:Transposon Tf2-11 polyprotein like [Argiope bruennichi]